MKQWFSIFSAVLLALVLALLLGLSLQQRGRMWETESARLVATLEAQVETSKRFRLGDLATEPTAPAALKRHWQLSAAGLELARRLLNRSVWFVDREPLKSAMAAAYAEKAIAADDTGIKF